MQNLVERPSDWPQNNREYQLSNVCGALERFIKEPNLQNKEFLFGLVTYNDLNERNQTGLWRFTEYEVALINHIYYYATITQCNQAKLFLYEFLIDTVILQKSTEMMIFNKSFEDTFMHTPYLRLVPTLKVFYMTYVYFRVEKDKTFQQQLCLRIKNLHKAAATQESLVEVIQASNNLMYDLSYVINSPKLTLLNFTRNELFKIYELLINLWNSNKINPNECPLRGIFVISIANWILKSRNNYDNSLIYKCIPGDACNKTFTNKQIWMRNVKDLNDKRESVPFSSLIANKTWIKKDWAKKFNITSDITRFVCSFSRKHPTEKMLNRYGHNIYGYKNDRIVNLISPIYTANGTPRFSLVMAYDIVYDSNLVKEEINFVANIIDLINISNDEKVELLTRLLSYWNLSIKDKKWSYENERRYEIRMYDEYKYIDSEILESFLKVSSSIYLLPDFVNRGNLMFNKIKNERINKLNCLSARDYLFCEDCLQADFDFYNSDDCKCKVCNSKNVRRIKV